MTAVRATACAALALCAAAAPTSAAARTRLTITYWPHGAGRGATTWRLTCAPAGGTHPHPRLACRELAVHAARLRAPVRACPFHPTVDEPQARVRGRIGAKDVDRTLTPACDARAFRDLRALLTGRA